MAINKLIIRDPSDLRIKHVNSKTVAFRRDLHIRGLRSTIRVMVQKVKFLVNSGASFFFFFFLLYILPPVKEFVLEFECFYCRDQRKEK
jgi:hypothetical protein